MPVNLYYTQKVRGFQQTRVKYSKESVEILEGVLILRNSSLKLKTVAGNAILLNYAVSSENISESIKIKTENGFNLKVNVCKFRTY